MKQEYAIKDFGRRLSPKFAQTSEKRRFMDKIFFVCYYTLLYPLLLGITRV